MTSLSDHDRSSSIPILTCTDYCSLSLPLLDVRQNHDDIVLTSSSATDDTLKTAVVVHIPLSHLSERLFELPPRNQPFAVLAEDQDQVDQLKDVLNMTNKNHRKQQQRPWNVVGALVVKANPSALLQPNSASDKTSIQPKRLPRLWQPDPMVQHRLLPILIQNIQKTLSNSCPCCYIVWDLGAGAGRDVAFLAEQLLLVQHQNNSFCIVGIDQFQRQECHAFWKRRNVHHFTASRILNLNQVSQVMELIVQQQVQCVYAVRYLNRPLLKTIAKTTTLHSIRIVAISHFGKAHVGARWDFPHPKEKHVLERNELQNIFGDWKILYDEVVSDTDHGRTIIQFVAMRD